jgi:hypothetical protein
VNIALPALVILLGLLPGIVFYYAYFAGRFEKRRAGVSALEEAAVYVVVAIPLDTFAFWLFRVLGFDLDLSMVARILIGNVAEPALQQMTARFNDSVVRTTICYLSVLATSAVAGWGLRRIVWTLRIDTYLGIFKLRHSWYYVFQARHRDLPPDALAFVYILTEHAEDKTRLYRGLVADYDLTSDGNLDSIILRGAMRGKGRGSVFVWVPIPGDLFVVSGRAIHSINVEYWRIDDAPDTEALDQAADPPPDEKQSVATESQPQPSN